MGIRLDWEIEAERTTIRGLGEDPDAARMRRRARFRLMVAVIVLLALIAGILGVIFYRLDYTERQVEQLLRDTVAAEVASLRIGNWNAFSQFQRSASPDWIPTQRELFEEYQLLLQRSPNAQLTGHIVGVTVDGTRGRVEIEEIVDGVPYARLWFYWRYEDDFDEDGEPDGWRHVPPDYTFWGDQRTKDRDFVRVDYHTVDEEMASLVAARLDEWIAIGCNALDCSGFPKIQVIIEPGDLPAAMGWSPADPATLIIESPYVTRARADLPFSPELQIEAAELLAERMVQHRMNDILAVYPADAYFLRQGIKSWLVGRFILIDTASYLVTSLSTHFGESAVGQLLDVMQPNSNVSVLSEVTGAPLDQSNLDWRDFFTWRLVTEIDLATQHNTESFLALYDTRDELVRNIAYTRQSQIPPGVPRVIQVQVNEPSPVGEPQLTAIVEVTHDDLITEEQVLFRLVNNNWLRAS